MMATTTIMRECPNLDWYPSEWSLYRAMVDYLAACRETMTYEDYTIVRSSGCPVINLCGDYADADATPLGDDADDVWITALHHPRTLRLRTRASTAVNQPQRTLTMTTYYYAIEWAYGPMTDSDTGECIGQYYRFGSRATRDAWIAKGVPDTTASGARSALRSTADTRRQAAEDEARRDELYAMLRSEVAIDTYAAVRAN